MIRVLQIFGEPLSNGGQEAFVMNMYRNIDRTKIQFDFYTPFFCDNEDLREEIENMGGKVYCSNGSFYKEGNKKDFINCLKNFLGSHKYEIVHINSGSVFSLAFGAMVARKNGARKVIVHSHCTGINNIKYRIIKLISKRIFLKYATDYLACSKEAAVWKFPRSIIKNNKYTIIKNGIELEKFVYDKKIRDEYRKQFGLSIDEFVIGHIGRFEEQKNHRYLIEVYETVLKKCPDSRLLLVGTGTLKEEIKEVLKEKNIIDKVIFLEKRKDVNHILQAMDVFVFPSIFEGLGIVAIEAQASGLITICSEHVPNEANVTDLFKKINLNEGKEKWAEEILRCRNFNRKGELQGKEINEYDAKKSAKNLEIIYLVGEKNEIKEKC